MALSDILAALEIGGEQLPEMVVVGVEPVTLETGLEMSDLVVSRIDPLIAKTVECLNNLGHVAKPIVRH